jgi:hypothetical protein
MAARVKGVGDVESKDRRSESVGDTEAEAEEVEAEDECKEDGEEEEDEEALVLGMVKKELNIEDDSSIDSLVYSSEEVNCLFFLPLR